jgi:hypothetical protein
MLLAARQDPQVAPKAVMLTNELGPFMWILRLSPDACLAVAPFSAIVGVATGIGFLCFQKWALAVAALDRIIPFGRFIILLPLLLALDKGVLSSITAAPLKTIDFFFSAFMLVYLARKDIRQLFGIT